MIDMKTKGWIERLILQKLTKPDKRTKYNYVSTKLDTKWFCNYYDNVENNKAHLNIKV